MNSVKNDINFKVQETKTKKKEKKLKPKWIIRFIQNHVIKLQS